ncbi:MAG: hypothetical protein WDO71_24765 [Bacteroidota bacterium]
MEKNTAIKKTFSELVREGLSVVKKRLVEKEKKNNGYLVISGKDGKVKKVPASEL